MPVFFYSTNDKSEKANFETALLNGMASNYGLYMLARRDIPKLSEEQIKNMRGKKYSEIAFEVLSQLLIPEIPEKELKELLDDAYLESKIPTKVQHVAGKTSIMWLTCGPTYSFKDYAARFFARALNYFLGKKGLKRTVIVATSGDTGGAVADALFGLENVDNIVFFPKGSVSEGQRRQMTTLGENVFAFEVNGDFDVCQALAKRLLGDKEFAKTVFGDSERLTSANSISVGRLLPQAVYPFFAYSRIAENNEPMIASIPSGNFGDMMGTVIAKEMGLPVSKILCGVNENTEFSEFMKTGNYVVRASVKSPSSAMIVSHPSNLARLFDFYGGHLFDERDQKTRKVLKEGVIDKMPDLERMKKDIFSISVNNSQHYDVMKEVFEKYKVILDPHGAVGWKTLDIFLEGKHDALAVVYETADPAKFPEDVKKAIGIIPELPAGMKKQAKLKERIYSIESNPEQTKDGLKLSDGQIEEAKAKLSSLFLLKKS
ncbi:MAG: threonine synthase [Candidatus Diapherotrites archaeon]|nr:threonine synthase [Candidatus Diapherotrites archaeon]